MIKYENKEAKFVGCVYELGEHNYYNDSDFMPAISTLKRVLSDMKNMTQLVLLVADMLQSIFLLIR